MFGSAARRSLFMAGLVFAISFGLFSHPESASAQGLGLRAFSSNRELIREQRAAAIAAREANVDLIRGQQLNQVHRQVQQLVVPAVPYVPAQQLLLIRQPAALISPPIVVQPLQVQAFYQPPALLLAPQQLNGQARLVVPGCSGL